MKNIIITTSIKKNSFGYHHQLDREWLTYFKNKQVNLFPFIFFNYSKNKIEKIFNTIKPIAVIFTGGNDLSCVKNNFENYLRDKLELNLLKYCIKNKITILAICRGFQLISTHFKAKILPVKNHVRKSHKLTIIKNNIIPHNKLFVNSFHDYGIFDLDDKIVILSKHIDGSVEIAHSERDKILGFQFHPERKNYSQKYIDKIIYNYLNI